jgi:hypothetical protein
MYVSPSNVSIGTRSQQEHFPAIAKEPNYVFHIFEQVLNGCSPRRY